VLLARFKHLTGIDRAIGFTVMARSWGATAGIITVLLIARRLTPSEQGYYYTFSSLVALQVVFELGFSFVILLLAAHERAQLILSPDGSVEGDSVAHARLASVLQKAVRWYFVAGLLMTLLLLPVGLHFFGSHQNARVVVRWVIPWCLLVIASMLAFQIDPVFSFLEGCGFIADVARRRLLQAVLGSVLAWIALETHHGLYAPALIILGQVVVGVLYLFFSKLSRLLKDLLFYPVGHNYVSWRHEIWPFQWKIAVSWLSGYFIYQLINPILFAYQGPVQAGRMGMSLSIAAAIGALAMAWMSTKASPFGGMVARGEYVNLDRIFFRTCWQSTVLLMAGEAAFLLALVIAGHSFPKFAMRVLQPWAFALMLFTTLLTHIGFCQATYLRSHKREPFLVITVIGAILVGGTNLILGRLWGINAVVVGNFVLALVYGLPAGTYVFITKRREWHNAPVRGSVVYPADLER
jgi:O-antigen/teichoic acid export membrane protein